MQPNLLAIDVIDNGVGIPTQLLHKIFEPFYTTKGRGKGTGLGLAIVQSVARALGGSVRLEPTPHSALHDGAHFVVELPVLDTAGEAHAR